MIAKFIPWIKDQGGPTQVAAKLNIDANSVRAWMEGKTSPSAIRMQALVKMGAGAFGYDEIISETKRQKRGTP